MPNPTVCERELAKLLCPACGATPDEACPLIGLSPELTTKAAIGAAKGAGDVSGDDGVCEACQ